MIAVIDYRAGNLYNVGNALKYLGVEYAFTSDAERILSAEKVILPGVGSARAAMQSLNEKGLCEVIRRLKVPFLGICLGMQLLYEESEEDSTRCLGIFPGRIRRFDREKVKVPHIGWNEVRWSSAAGNRVSGSVSGCYYFVHSYYAPVSDDYTIGVTDYDVEFSSAAACENFYGFQFHPERSGEIGLHLLSRFVQMNSDE